ncbi:MAG: hypothetical protein CBC01_06175 [Betaproteobacteria bacterium TMED41]|nr:MAG: hypothetical protein CBC01_06175 [Betaproteobacteria bacterium TMED41]
MPINYGSDTENPEISRNTVSDPMADHKRRARQRLIGSVFFSFSVFFLCIFLLRDEPRSFVENVEVEGSFEEKFSKKIKNTDKVLGEKINLSSRDKRIIELSNSLVWMVRVGVFEDKTNAQNLKNRLIAEGKPVKIIPKKIGHRFVFYVKAGPFTQELAEKFRRQALSRGLDADIDRL